MKLHRCKRPLRDLTLYVALGSLGAPGCGKSFQAAEAQAGTSGAARAGDSSLGGASGTAVGGHAGYGGAAGPDIDVAGAAGTAEDTGGSGPSTGGSGPSTGGSSSGVAGGAGSAGAATMACPTGALFCDDFDQGAFGDRWDAVDHSSASLDTSLAYSKPSSLHLVLAAQKNVSTALLMKSLTKVGDVLRVSFYLRINHEAEIYPFGLFYPTNDYRISLHLDGFAKGSLAVAEGTTGKFGDGSDYGEHFTTAALSTENEWRHVEVSIRSGAGTVSVRVDEATVLEETKLLGAAFLHDGTCSLGLGIYYAFAQTSWDANFDSVVITSP